LKRRFTYTRSGKVQHEIQDGLTSLNVKQASPKRLLELIRAEWGIENGLHYHRDVTFREDKTRMTCKHKARAMACVNNLIIALLCKQGFTNHARARRFYDANPFATLALILRL